MVGCKKDFNPFHKNSKTNLPNYGNVDINDVFSKEDSQLDSNKDSILYKINNYYDNTWEKGDLSGSFLIAKGDQILIEKYRGFARENNMVPINKNVPLHVASISKTITAMAVLKLIEAGKIKMHDKVTKYFPKFPYPDVEVFHLLSHRSGLPKYEYFLEKIPLNPNKKFLTNKEILQLLIQFKPELSKMTGTGFMYCNTNFMLLALIVEKVTGTTFPDAMQQIVFKPLKMKHTFIFQAKDSTKAAQSFYYNDNRLIKMDRLDLVYGDKNCYTTPRDLLNFSKALFSKNFLRPSLKDSIFTPYSNEKPGVNNYGLGFRMKIFDNGEKLTFHNGWWHGSNASFAHLLKSKVTIIAIGNKFSRRVYSVMSLSGLFENFPMAPEKLEEAIAPEQDSLKVDNESEGGSTE